MLHQNTNSALNAILHKQRASFLASDTASAKVRRERIDRLIALLMTHANDFAETMREDFGHRSPMMSFATDILGILPSLKHSRANLGKWMRPRPVRAGRLVRH